MQTEFYRLGFSAGELPGLNGTRRPYSGPKVAARRRATTGYGEVGPYAHAENGNPVKMRRQAAAADNVTPDDPSIVPTATVRNIAYDMTGCQSGFGEVQEFLMWRFL